MQVKSPVPWSFCFSEDEVQQNELHVTLHCSFSIVKLLQLEIFLNFNC